MVKIHHGEGPSPLRLRSMKGFNLDTGNSTHGGHKLIYTFSSKDMFGAYCQQHTDFKIITGLGNKIDIGVGKYDKGRGAKSQTFDPTSYLHQRNALLGSFGEMPEDSMKVGVKGHRVSFGNVLNKAKAGADWIASPAEKLLGLAFSKSRYFVVFTTVQAHIIMHQQEGLLYLATKKDHFTEGERNVYISLGDVYKHYSTQIEGFLKEV
jgi:hypothetical protein